MYNLLKFEYLYLNKYKFFLIVENNIVYNVRQRE